MAMDIFVFAHTNKQYFTRLANLTANRSRCLMINQSYSKHY